MDSYLLFLQYAQDEISKLMDISLRFTQLESGREEELLLYPKIPIGYTTSTWTTQLRNFMGTHHDLRIERTRGWQPRTQCVHDQMIMSLFLKKGRHIRLSVFTLKACRMFVSPCQLFTSRYSNRGWQLHPTRNSGVQSNFTTKLTVDLATTTRPNAPTTRQLERSNY